MNDQAQFFEYLMNGGDTRSQSIDTRSEGTIENESFLEAFPFEDDPEFLALPELEKEIMKQAYRNNMATGFQPNNRFSGPIPG